MSSGIFLVFVLEVVVVLVLCVVKVVILIIEGFKIFLVYFEIVFRDIVLCGCMKLINNFFVLFLRGFVFWMYFFNMDSG